MSGPEAEVYKVVDTFKYLDYIIHYILGQLSPHNEDILDAEL